MQKDMHRVLQFVYKRRIKGFAGISCSPNPQNLKSGTEETLVYLTALVMHENPRDGYTRNDIPTLPVAAWEGDQS